jgi:hypothetical protein
MLRIILHIDGDIIEDLSLLFVYAKKDKFYPAMPFITAGCNVGWLIVLLL